jgi:hypothetical protein
MSLGRFLLSGTGGRTGSTGGGSESGRDSVSVPGIIGATRTSHLMGFPEVYRYSPGCPCLESGLVEGALDIR